MSPGRFDDLQPRALPPVPPLWAALGPGIVWMARAILFCLAAAVYCLCVRIRLARGAV